MFKIIAAIAALRDLTQRLSLWLDDVRQRVVGAGLSAATENIVANNEKFKAVQADQRRAAEQATEDLNHDLRVAHEAYSKALNVIGTVCDSHRDTLNAKAKALREKHARLRALL